MQKNGRGGFGLQPEAISKDLVLPTERVLYAITKKEGWEDFRLAPIRDVMS